MARRNELSTRNPWYLPKHRFLELKHYCLQVPDWQKRIRELRASIGPTVPKMLGVVSGVKTYPGMPFEKEILECDQLRRKIDPIMESCDVVVKDIFLGRSALIELVTEDVGFEYVQQKYDLPISRDTWYRNYYRKFFWVLDKELRKEERG